MDHDGFPEDENSQIFQDEDARTDGADWDSEKDALGNSADDSMERSENGKVREEEVVKKKKRKRNPDKPKRRKTLLAACK